MAQRAWVLGQADLPSPLFPLQAKDFGNHTHTHSLPLAGNYSPVLVTQLDAKKKGYSE